MTEVRLITFMSPILDSVAVITSVSPSAKFSSEAPFAKLSNGNTAMDLDGIALRSTVSPGFRKTNAKTPSNNTRKTAAIGRIDFFPEAAPAISTLPWLIPTGSPSLVTQNTSNSMSIPLSLGKPMLCVLRSAWYAMSRCTLSEIAMPPSGETVSTRDAMFTPLPSTSFSVWTTSP